MCCLLWFVYPVSRCGSWKKLQVGEDDDWGGKEEEILTPWCAEADHVPLTSESCGKRLKWPVFPRNFRKPPRVEESCAAGMRIIQQWLSWENNYASDLCWDLCGLRRQTFERCQSCRCKQPPWVSCGKQTCPLDLVLTQQHRNHRVTTGLSSQLLSWWFLPPGCFGDLLFRLGGFILGHYDTKTSASTIFQDYRSMGYVENQAG